LRPRASPARSISSAARPFGRPRLLEYQAGLSVESPLALVNSLLAFISVRVAPIGVRKSLLPKRVT
jgi:hypothetical protein